MMKRLLLHFTYETETEKLFTQDHIIIKRQSQDSNPGNVTPLYYIPQIKEPNA